VLILTFAAIHFCFLPLFPVQKPLRGDLHFFESEIKITARKAIIQPNILGFLGMLINCDTLFWRQGSLNLSNYRWLKHEILHQRRVSATDLTEPQVSLCCLPIHPSHEWQITHLGCRLVRWAGHERNYRREGSAWHKSLQGYYQIFQCLNLLN
jgi:hypothetical protein